MEYEFHSYCTLFPQADEKTLAGIASDIQTNGLNEPIVLFEGKILDGRNRFLACTSLGIEPTFKEYTGDEPLQYVISKNLHRRHLNESQRALLAQKIWKLSGDSGTAKVTQDDVRKQFNVSAASVRKAARISDVAIDDVKQQVEVGTLSINKAASIVKKAEKKSGITHSPNMTPEDLRKLKLAQKEIINDDAPESVAVGIANAKAEEFNQSVLTGVYDGKRYRRDVQEIQSIIAKIETLPSLFNDAVDLVGTLEQERVLISALDMMTTSVKKAMKKFQMQSISYDEVLSVAAALMDGRFALPELSDSAVNEHELLDQLKAQYLADCEACLKDVSALKKKLKTADSALSAKVG